MVLPELLQSLVVRLVGCLPLRAACVVAAVSPTGKWTTLRPPLRRAARGTSAPLAARPWTAGGALYARIEGAAYPPLGGPEFPLRLGWG